MGAAGERTVSSHCRCDGRRERVPPSALLSCYPRLVLAEARQAILAAGYHEGIHPVGDADGPICRDGWR